jgi:hypothetical protein
LSWRARLAADLMLAIGSVCGVVPGARIELATKGL